MEHLARKSHYNPGQRSLTEFFSVNRIAKRFRLVPVQLGT